MKTIPKLLEEVINLPRIKEYNIISDYVFEKIDNTEDEVLFVHYRHKGIYYSKGFDTRRTDFEESIAEWIIEDEICSYNVLNKNSEYYLLSKESRKALDIARSQLKIKEQLKKDLDKALDKFKEEMLSSMSIAVNDIFNKINKEAEDE